MGSALEGHTFLDTLSVPRDLRLGAMVLEVGDGDECDSVQLLLDCLLVPAELKFQRVEA
jgi:hypothetical protein